jgi:hypothetical protein
MNRTGRLPCNSADRLHENQLAAYVDAFRHHLTERRYASHTIDEYVACLACVRTLDESVSTEY